MAKKAFVGVLLGTALVFSLGVSPVSALTADEVQAQIKALLSQVADLSNLLNRLRAQSNTGVGVTVNPMETVVPNKHRICGILNRNLSQGTKGDDVTSLQEFLQSEGYLSANATGFFGPMTAQAVAKWQAKEGVSAVGAFGPMSRDRVKIWCGGGVGMNENFRASPQRGTAPLTVTFYAKVSGLLPADSYMIEFGDGSSEPVANCYAAADACNRGPETKTQMHTYASNGTYTATLIHTIDLCGGNPACMAPISREVVGKIQIHVGSIACTKEYKPVCGAQPIVCITTPCNPIPTTYGNRCEMNADGASFLYEGQCKTSYSDPKNDPMCKAWNDGISCGGMSCGRDVPGGTPSCSTGDCYPTTPQPAASWRCTAWFGNSGNKPPTISGFSGPTTLAVNTTGTWTINASDPENGQLSYQVWWGDESYAPMASMASYAREFVQATTFTHAYINAGTYTVSIVVRDSSGQEAKTSTTVRVGSDMVCTGEYAPVCGRPVGCANTCPSGQYCTMICQLHRPETYGNRCALNAAGAEFLYNGMCATSTY